MTARAFLALSPLLVPALLAAACCLARGSGPEGRPSDEGAAAAVQGGPEGRLTVDDPVSAIMGHPAFEGFGRLLMPWDDKGRRYDMPISQVAGIMPYHSHVRPEAVAAAVNWMIGEAESGKEVFYRFYSEKDIAADPSKGDTGLFFFRGKPGAPFAVICPGGGFSYVGSLHEGFPLAVELAKNGYNAFSIKYRTGGEQRATEDLAAALSWIFRNKGALGVGTDGYSVWGGSAGARMAANIGSWGAAAFGGDSLPRPAVIVMQYTGHSDYTKNDPPTYVCIGENDGIASPRAMKRRTDALESLGIDTEFHVFPNLGHGFALGLGTSAEGWERGAMAFWERHSR